MKKTIKEIFQLKREMDQVFTKNGINVPFSEDQAKQYYGSYLYDLFKIAGFFSSSDQNLSIEFTQDEGGYYSLCIVPNNDDEYEILDINIMPLEDRYLFCNNLSYYYETVIEKCFLKHEQNIEDFYNFCAKIFDWCWNFNNEDSEKVKSKLIDLIKSKNIILAVELLNSHLKDTE